MIKLSVNETKWSILLARTRALIFIFGFEYLISRPKSYRDFRETGSWKNAIQRPGKSSCVLASRLAEGFPSVRDRNKVHICYPLSEAHVH